jgi:uncharacterized protein YdiU (UPF0061 family)
MNALECPAHGRAHSSPLRRIEQLPFENRYATLPDRFHARLRPTPLPDPYLVAFNPDAAPLIGLDPAEAERPEFAAYFAGNLVPAGAEPLAAVYAGHQFGVWVPQLGDGRAILLGEVRAADGPGRWDVQLKGSGRTPYSRMGDGRAVLRSTIREYLCSEAMHGLGIPTTRALAIVGSNAPVIRENVETAAVLTRMAPTHVRFGTFEFFCWSRQPEAVRTLADHVLAEHYAELAGGPDAYVRLLTTVVDRTARLIADWMAVGFCHGVMNTDNMSILGLTIDYGPFGFLDGFDWGHVCNHSDGTGRYAYRMQPGIAYWNLERLAQALSPLVPAAAAQAALEPFEPTFLAAYGERMTAKLGLEAKHEDDDELVRELLALMHESRTDYTIFFRRLAPFDDGDATDGAPLRDFFVDREKFDAWAQRYRERLAWESSDARRRRERMNRVNPKYVLRNHLAEVAIRKARDERDYGEIERLRRLLARPFDEQPEMEAYAALPPDWAGSIAVSCSS